MKTHMYNGPLSYSFSPIIHVDRGYATIRHEFEPYAKPWSELFRQTGPSLKSSISPYGEIKTRSLDHKANTIDSQDRKNNDSSTSIADQETTTFYMAASIYIKDILLMTQQN
jgi:hypothetical protein